VSNINSYLNDLKDARHALAHKGEQSNDFVIIEYYMVWFPLAFIVAFGKDKIDGSLVLRLLFFLAASNVKAKDWQRREDVFTSAGMKRTLLESYEYISRVMPKKIQENNVVYIQAHLQGFLNSMNLVKKS
jgi:hypothetical protein